MMDNKVCSVLTVCLLFMAALHLEAVVKKKLVYYPFRWMTWENARLHCQEKGVDLVSLQQINAISSLRPSLLMYLNSSQLIPLWTGFIRHPENASVWTGVDYRTGGLLEDDVSQMIRWDDQNVEPLCAFVMKTDQMWHSDLCSKKKFFYCSLHDGVKHFKMHKSWSKASKYCEKRSGQLLDLQNITGYTLKETGWIGSYEKKGVWSLVGNFTPFHTNWAPNEPQSRDCACYNSSSERYHKTLCSRKIPPLCLSDNLLVVNESKTWDEAQNHCLQMNPCRRWKSCNHTYNLLSVNKMSDYNYIRDRIYRVTTAEVGLLLVWIGLRFLGGLWWWVDGQGLDETWTLPSCPFERRHCGTLSKSGTRTLNIRDCSEKRNFICYKN